MLEKLLNDVALYFDQGGYVMLPLLVTCILLWFALGYRVSALRRGSRRSVRVLIDRYRQGNGRMPRGVIDRAVAEGLRIANSPRSHLRRHLDEAFIPLQRELKRYSVLIRTLVTVAPILGLLGTVIGMIETFRSLSDPSLFSQSGGIAGGIAEALLITQLGLALAIPGLFINGFLERRRRAMEMELTQIKDILCSHQSRGDKEASA